MIVAERGSPSHMDVARRLIRDRETRCGEPRFVAAYLRQVIAEEPHAHWTEDDERAYQAFAAMRARIKTAWSAIRRALAPPTQHTIRQSDYTLAGPTKE